MKKLIVFALIFGFITLGILPLRSYAQLTLTQQQIEWVQARRQIKMLQNQIEIEKKNKAAAVTLTRRPFDITISSLRAQIKTLAESIGLTVDDFRD